MNVLLVAPLEPPRAAELDNTLEAMQQTVGGPIQAVYPFEEPVALICHEEGKLVGLPLNRCLRLENGEIYDISATHYKTAVQVLPGRVSQMADFAAFFGIDIYSIYTQLKLAIAPAVQIMQEYQGGFLDDLILNDLGYDEFCLADISTDMTDALESIEAIFDIANEEQFYFFPACDAAAASLLKNARDCYAAYGQETPLLLYDATLMKSGKSGFLITDKHIYLNDTGVSAQLTLQDALQDIHQKKNESNGCNYLYFGEYG